LLIVAQKPETERIATVYQEELKRAGLAMTIRRLEFNTLIERLDTHNFDGAVMGWSVPRIEADGYQLWHSSQTVGKGSNFVGFANDEADRIIEEARLEFDEEKRYALNHRFHAVLHEEQPYTFLFCMQTLQAVDRRFHNVHVYPAGLDAREWWVPTPLQRYP
jgi:peptide/nickel transport system substrate-binding protein